MTTLANDSGLNSIACSMFSFTFSIRISSAICICSSGLRGSALSASCTNNKLLSFGFMRGTVCNRSCVCSHDYEELVVLAACNTAENEAHTYHALHLFHLSLLSSCCLFSKHRSQ